MIEFSAKVAKIWKSRRARIILSAILTGVFFGISALGLPAEDVLSGTRTLVWRETAPQDIVVVEIDESTLSQIGTDDTPRSADAKLVKTLFDQGVSRVFFDRTYYFQEDAAGDQALAKALKQYPDRVFMGALKGETDSATEVSMLPAGIFRGDVGVVSLMAYYHPFKLSVSFPFKSSTPDGEVPSMAAKLADLDNPPEGMFKPDYAMDASTIPRFSYIDVLNQKVPDAKLQGRDVVIAPSAITFNDYHAMPFQGIMPGAYFQVIAAHTLRRGVPRDLGWIPAFVLVSILVISGVGRGRSIDRYRISGLVIVLVGVPFVFDRFNITVEIVPAIITAGIAIFRARALDRVEKAAEINVASGLPSLQSLRTSSELQPGSLIALKLRNYRAITGSFVQPIEAQLAAEIVRRIRITDPGAVVYHESDMFIWSSVLANPVDLFEHLEGLHSLVQNGLIIEDREIDVSFNCGIETQPDRPLASRVGAALQSAEQAVRNDELVCLYEPARNEVQWEVSLLSSLDRAIDNGEVWVAYQPKLDLLTNRITSAEALVRWTHPERGPISPEHFIGIAEEYHRIERITQFVLHEAVRSTLSVLPYCPDFTVSVNISAQLLRNSGLPKIVFDALNAYGLHPKHLILEITETDRLDRSSATHDMMMAMVNSGLQLSIDDFGTGNATIDYLRYLPAVEVKIDKAFVAGIERSQEDVLLVQSIIEMAHSLKRRVVAEGIENKEIKEILRGMGCDQGQGYYISRPILMDDLRTLLGAELDRVYS